MESLIANITGKVRRESRNGRDYLVAPISLIVPGVLNGSRGRLYYPKDEVARSVDIWNGQPLVVYHPTNNGRPVSARNPDVAFKSKVGRTYNARLDRNGRLIADAWFDVETANRVDKRILDALQSGTPMEISTGLFTDTIDAEPGSVDDKGRAYDYVARNYRADHIAILPDQRGACSLEDGCGLLVTHARQWQTLNVSKAGRSIPPKRGKGKGDDDSDEGGKDFASDEQRRAFFGKLRQGKITETKSTKPVKKDADKSSGEKTTAIKPKSVSDVAGGLRSQATSSGVRLDHDYDAGKEYLKSKGGELISSRKGVNGKTIETWRVQGEDGDLLATWGRGGAIMGSGRQLPDQWQIMLQKGGNSSTPAPKELREDSPPEKPKDTSRLVEKMKAKGRELQGEQNPQSKTWGDLYPPWLKEATAKFRGEDTPGEKSARERGEALRQQWLKEDKEAGEDEKKRNAARHRYESGLHKARIKVTSQGFKVRNKSTRIHTVRNKAGIEVDWQTLNVKEGEDFDSDEQRRAFFGKLAAGDIKGTKSTDTGKSSSSKSLKDYAGDEKKMLATVKHEGTEYHLYLKKNKTQKGGYDVTIRPSSGGKEQQLTSLGSDHSVESAIKFIKETKLAKGSEVGPAKEETKKGKEVPSLTKGKLSNKLKGIDSKVHETADGFKVTLSKPSQDAARLGQLGDSLRGQGYKVSYDEHGSMYVRNALPSDKADVSPEKACKILHDGTAQGHPLTDKQRKMFGAICSERTDNAWHTLNYSPDQPRDARGKFTRKSIASLPPKRQSLFNKVLGRFGIGKGSDVTPTPEPKAPSTQEKIADLKKQVKVQKSAADSIKRHLDSLEVEHNHKRAFGQKITKKGETRLRKLKREYDRAQKKYSRAVEDLSELGGSMEGDTKPESVKTPLMGRVKKFVFGTNADASGDILDLLMVLEDELGRELTEDEIDRAVKEYIDGVDDDEVSDGITGNWQTLNLFGSGGNCGIAKGGFQKGNTCAKGDGQDLGPNPESGLGGSDIHKSLQKGGSFASGAFKEIDRFFGGGNKAWSPTERGAQRREEVKEVFKGIFSRLTLGTGPLVAKGIAAGVRIAPKAFNLLIKGLQAIGPRKQLVDKAQDMGANPSSGGSGQSANPMGQAGAGGEGRKRVAEYKTVRNVSPPSKKANPIDERAKARAEMYFAQLQEILKQDPDELQKLLLACKEAMKVVDQGQQKRNSPNFQTITTPQRN